ncbi:MAG: nitroreductase family protein, partial [Lachnospiraceae bacterium]|nr:nitroreductase family protein [Lachnospiraceae bacterium]
MRKYSDRKLDAESIERIMEAGRLAPTASNQQLNKHIIVTDPELIRGMVEACENQTWVGTAPAIL